MTKTITVEKTVTIDLDLDEFDTDELIQELKSRHLTRWAKKELLEFVSEFKIKTGSNTVMIETETLADVMKVELLQEAVKKYSYIQLSTLLA